MEFPVCEQFLYDVWFLSYGCQSSPIFVFLPTGIFPYKMYLVTTLQTGDTLYIMLPVIVCCSKRAGVPVDSGVFLRRLIGSWRPKKIVKISEMSGQANMHTARPICTNEGSKRRPRNDVICLLGVWGVIHLSKPVSVSNLKPDSVSVCTTVRDADSFDPTSFYGFIK